MELNEKQNAWFTVSIIAVIFLIVTIADLLFGSRLFVRKEGVKDLSEPGTESIVSGVFERAYEEYTKEHFIGLQKYQNIKLGWDILTQKKDFNGIYLGRKGQLFAAHPAEDYPENLQDRSIAFLKNMAENWNAMILVVPTADGFYPDRLPAYADFFSQEEYLAKVAQAVGTDHYISAYGALLPHAQEELYYRTDSHWTSLGAYYCYLEWQKKAGKHYSYDYDVQKMTCLSTGFRGDLWQATGFPTGKMDSMYLFTETKEQNVTITFEDGSTRAGYYNIGKLRTEDKYDYFPGEDYGFFTIHTGYKRWKTLFVIKDSYGDCMLPLLAPYYKEIYVVDAPHYQGDVFRLMEELREEDRMDVLVVGNVPDMISKADFVRWEE